MVRRNFSLDWPTIRKIEELQGLTSMSKLIRDLVNDAYEELHPGGEPQWEKYRKKAVVVDAYQLKRSKEITTLEGVLRAKGGDWIVKGVVGEMYPVRADVFVETYEKVED